MKFSIPWSINEHFGFDPLPLINLYFRTTNGAFEGRSFLVDSGADVSMAPVEFADEIGLDRDAGFPTRIRGIAPNDECVVPGVILPVEVHVLEAQSRLVIPICFAEGDVQFLLGRADFFESFLVQFDQPSLLTHFELAESSEDDG
jgi:hypothetical protein